MPASPPGRHEGIGIAGILRQEGRSHLRSHLERNGADCRAQPGQQFLPRLVEARQGRIANVEMWPFKQGEIHDRPVPAIYECLIDAETRIADFTSLAPVTSIAQSMQCWFQGGFPEPVLHRHKQPQFHNLWMENYLADYVNRDIRVLFPRLNIHSFRRFLSLLAQFSGHQLNMSSMARALEVTVPTIRDYLDIIHQTLLVAQSSSLHQKPQVSLRPRERFWDIQVPKIDSAFDSLFVPRPSRSLTLRDNLASSLPLRRQFPR